MLSGPSRTSTIGIKNKIKNITDSYPPMSNKSSLFAQNQQYKSSIIMQAYESMFPSNFLEGYAKRDIWRART